MRYGAILMMSDNFVRGQIERLFTAMDILYELGNVHPEERRTHNQLYRNLRSRLNLKQILEVADEGMVERTSRYDGSLI